MTAGINASWYDANKKEQSRIAHDAATVFFWHKNHCICKFFLKRVLTVLSSDKELKNESKREYFLSLPLEDFEVKS